MIKKKIKILFFILTSSVFSQMAGDILFVGFNADGDKDFAILTMKNLTANTIIYFTDNEPNATGDGYSDSEGVLKWNTGISVIPQGTVIQFSDVDSSSNINFGSSLGVLTVENAGFNINASDGDSVYATYGNPVNNSVTTWITGIQNNNNALETNFNATGLNINSNYIVIDATASKDGGEYTGIKSNKIAGEYAALIVDENNWTTSTTDGESFLPFTSTSFSFKTGTLSLHNNAIKAKINISVENNKFIASKGKIVKIRNILGQEIKNQNILTNGMFLVVVNYQERLNIFKILK